MMVDVRVSSAVHIPHSSGKVTIYSLVVRIFFAENTSGKWPYRIPGLLTGKNQRDPGHGEKQQEHGLEIRSISHMRMRR